MSTKTSNAYTRSEGANVYLYTIVGPFNEFVAVEWAASPEDAIERVIGKDHNNLYSAHTSEPVSVDSLEY